MHVLLLYDCVYPESLGGIEHRNHELARELAGRGHRVTLAGFCRSEAEPPTGVEVVSLGDRGRLYSSSGRRSTWQAVRYAALATGLDLAPYDVVETANIPYVHLPLLALRCRLAGKPLLVTWYEFWGSYWRSYLRSPLWPVYAGIERGVARLGTLRLASSELTADRLERRGGRVAGVVACGLDVSRVRSLASRARPGPPIVYAGRLHKEKRIDLLLEAVAEMVPRFEPPLLAIVGDGPDRDRLEWLAAELGLERHVEFTGKLPSNRDVWRRLGGAKVAVQPSEREGFGMFPLEAMAAGLPVVYCASPDSAVPGLVRHGKEGLEVAPEAPALAEALQRLLRSPEERKAFGAAARRRAAEFDWSHVTDRFESICQELLEGSRGV